MLTLHTEFQVDDTNRKKPVKKLLVMPYGMTRFVTAECEDWDEKLNN